MKKTTIYIDVDDDIAAIIEKLENADQKIVALVLPKRPTTLQGSVNLQLLKKSSDELAKNLVLITTDEQVMQLAGESGIHVSSSLQSKPYIPSVNSGVESDVPIIVDRSEAPVNDSGSAQPEVYAGDKKLDLSTPIGELTGNDEEIEFDNADKPEDEIAEKSDEEKSKKKISVPNFGAFRTRLIGGSIAAIALIALFVWGAIFAPSATIIIRTEKTEVEAKLTLVASAATQAVNAEKGEVPAVRKEDKQKLTGTFSATGQKDVGNPARGQVSFRNCESPSQILIPKGTGVSRADVTFITQEDYTVPGATIGPGLSCDSSYAGSVDVVANKPGGQYNYSDNTQYTIGSSFGNISVLGEAMGGGDTKIVKVVTDADIETAKAKVLETGADNVKGKLAELLKAEGLVPIEETFTTTEGAPSSSIPVGQEAASDPTLTIELTSTMLGMKVSDVDPLLLAELQKKIDTTKQKVYQSGATSSRIVIDEKLGGDSVKISMISTASVGPNLSVEQVAQEIAGTKAGEAKQLLEAHPGVSGVDIDLNPFWVFSIPNKTSKISITINE